MLTQISIRQFALVDTLEVEFEGGLTVLTGETGAGKSIILDALGLCLGDRADPAAIRPGSERAELCARFDLRRIPAARAWLAARELDDDNECLLRRVLTREGRSRAFINGSPASAQDCTALGELLIDIHGQQAHQSLLRRSRQRLVLDGYAQRLDTAREVEALARDWKTRSERLESLRGAESERVEREQLLRYQVQELVALALAPGELTALENERHLLANADAIARQSARAIELCETHEAGVRRAHGELDPQLHDPDAVGNALHMLESAAIHIDEARRELQGYLSNCESNPERLAEIEVRLGRVYELARKYRLDAEALPARHRELALELDALDCGEDRLEALQSELDGVAARYRDAAGALSTARARAGKKLEKAVAGLFDRLSMGACRFSLALRPRRESTPHPLGDEEVEFLIATLPGAALQPLARVASGGELSRISLAIQVASAGAGAAPCTVFDEVDVGIGGAVAEVVGRLLADMGRDAQVICVTHLPQVAAQGSQHLRVVKSGTGRRLASSLARLSDAQRIDEIARMLGGLKVTESTLAHARDMLSLDD